MALRASPQINQRRRSWAMRYENLSPAILPGDYWIHVRPDGSEERFESPKSDRLHIRQIDLHQFTWTNNIGFAGDPLARSVSVRPRGHGWSSCGQNPNDCRTMWHRYNYRSSPKPVETACPDAPNNVVSIPAPEQQADADWLTPDKDRETYLATKCYGNSLCVQVFKLQNGTLVEQTQTLDIQYWDGAWGVGIPDPPIGQGWKISNGESDKKTIWRRLRAVENGP
jgi:hypothetical protein